MIKDIILIKVLVLLQSSKDFTPHMLKRIDPRNIKTGLVPVIAWTIETEPDEIAIITNIFPRAAPSSVIIIKGPFLMLKR